MLFGAKQPVVAKASTVIKKPVVDVFHFIGEDFFSNYPKWSPEVVELKPLSTGPVQVGSMAWQVRVDRGHRTESTFAVTDLQPNRRIAFSGVSNAFHCAYELRQAGPDAATQVAFTFELPELELYMRPFEQLIRLAVQEGAERTVQNLKGLLENPTRSMGG
ncbi:Polyketide cyclase / dehydrase and lipid transport [Methylomagnum ishizawai]|uniref:Polyketide cyclase / dehydrase and lipid transport n=1 Tax=Methylomagnum ishizawai TaxID=1760988 RepID=A0A1Y6D3Q4_9GAMM|nr:SRPBCC family protein [Methylomagnum ishizawai]SMF97287.1 Polyketide cyclase / dehydrase and lipid transport [Methylomagnum ishizawai]